MRETPAVDPDDGPDEALLERLAGEGELELDAADGDFRAASDGLDVETPAGRLRFTVYPVEDYGSGHDRHDPERGVHVNQWFRHGFAIVHVHDVDADEHSLLVRPQTSEERAMELRDHGVPDRRAAVVALRERGLSYSDIVEATGDEGPNHRGDVSRHLQRFNEELRNARWLVEHADVLEMGGSR